MASKIIANLIILGSGIVVRAFAQAYRQAIVNASKTGVAEEVVRETGRRSRAMSVQEARQILGVSDATPWEEVVQKYETMFRNNERVGSFYLQSKVQRAKERLEAAQRGGGAP